jgi:hypothetical protein
MYCLAWEKGKDTDFGVAKIAFETRLGVGQIGLYWILLYN